MDPFQKWLMTVELLEIIYLETKKNQAESGMVALAFPQKA